MAAAVDYGQQVALDALADLDLIPAPGAWSDDAACGPFAESFLPPRKPEPEELAVVTGVCRHCPVRDDCAIYAARWPVYGVWAGRWYDTTRTHRKRA